MNKRIFILISVVLAVGIVVAGVLYTHETGKLEDALAEISGLEAALTAAETEVSILEEALAAAEAEVSILEAELALQPVTFPDLSLLAAIREAIDKPEGPIYGADLNSLTVLSASGRGISDLTGLGYFVNLEVLGLVGNNISDISALAGLTNLWSLGLGANDINDISDLAGLINLKSLLLENNLISDISTLSGLTSLHNLYVSGNNISDLKPLVDNIGLTQGEFVYVYNNPLSTTSVDVYIPQLEARGVLIDYEIDF